MRTWYKVIPPKYLHEKIGMYQSVWLPQMDRCWESDDGYSVMSRRIRTDIGIVDHVTIQRMGVGGDVPWAVKQEIKDRLFGIKTTAIEVFPAKKNLIDVCDVYHLWILPEDCSLPFGIHPMRDPMGEPIERGYDFNMEEVTRWVDSPERKLLLGVSDGNREIT